MADRKGILPNLDYPSGPTYRLLGFDTVVAWAKAACAALGPDSAEYSNYTGETSAERVHASYPSATYARLAAVKRQYDPTNLFRLNQNIRPSATR